MKGSLEENIGKIVGALQRVYEGAGDRRAARLLAACAPELKITEYDNWNGGTYHYALSISVPPGEYAAYSDQAALAELERDILERIERFTRLYPNEYLGEVVVVPDLDRDDEREMELVEQPSFWREGFLRLFISHVATIKEDAAALADQLAGYGISGFVAHLDIEPTKKWEDEIRLGLSTCDALTALLTSDFHQSKWTDQEVGVAVGRGILVIPVRLGLDPYGFIGRFQGFQGRGLSTESLARSIYEIALKHPATRSMMAQALVTLFEQSDSFAEAKANVQKLRVIGEWDERLASRVRRAVDENDQISKAWRVPEQVEHLLRNAGFAAVSVSTAE